MTPVTRIVAIATIAITLIGAVVMWMYLQRENEKLPVLGNPGHQAGPFRFTNQYGQVMTSDSVRGKVQVVEFFFTTCPGICKVMNKNLKEVYQTYKDDSRFVILSHTVNPEDDSVPVLKRYADSIGAVGDSWQLMTGPKKELYHTAKMEYLLGLGDPELANMSNEFIHTEYIALLDQDRQIRGFYDATKKDAIDKLRKDIDLLLSEY